MGFERLMPSTLCCCFLRFCHCFTVIFLSLPLKNEGPLDCHFYENMSPLTSPLLENVGPPACHFRKNGNPLSSPLLENVGPPTCHFRESGNPVKHFLIFSFVLTITQLAAGGKLLYISSSLSDECLHHLASVKTEINFLNPPACHFRESVESLACHFCERGNQLTSLLLENVGPPACHFRENVELLACHFRESGNLFKNLPVTLFKYFFNFILLL